MGLAPTPCLARPTCDPHLASLAFASPGLLMSLGVAFVTQNEASAGEVDSLHRLRDTLLNNHLIDAVFAASMRVSSAFILVRNVTISTNPGR